MTDSSPRKFFNLTNLPPHVSQRDIDERLLWLAYYASGASEQSSVEQAHAALVGVYVDGEDAAEQLTLAELEHVLPFWVWGQTWSRMKHLYSTATVQNWLYVFRLET